MTSGKHIAVDAVALAALPATSLQRQAAEAHAKTCPDCARALRQGERVLEMLDMSLDPPAPSAAVLQQAMNRTRRLAALHIAGPPILTVVAISAAIAGFTSFPGEGLRWLGSAILAVSGVALSWLAVSRRTVRPVAGAAFLGSVIFAAALAGDGPLAPVLGIRCCMAELVPAAIAIAVIFGLRQSAVLRDRWRVVALVGATVLTVQAALLVSCPERLGALHMLVFHTGGLVVICSAAALLAPRLARRAGALAQGLSSHQ
jgi:hypothetical protein